MVAPLPPGVISAGAGRFTYSHRSTQVYFGLVFAVIGTVVPIIIIATQVRAAARMGMSPDPVFFIVPVIIGLVFGGVGAFFCYKFKWSKLIMDFNQRNINYITAAFPFILCQEPNKSASIDQLANLIIHETGISQGGRRGRAGTPILEIRIDLGNGDFVPLASVAGHYNVQPTLSKWTLWLADMGVTVNTAAIAMPQLLAIMPMTQQPMMMMQQQPGSPMMYSPHVGTPMNGMYPGTAMPMQPQQQMMAPSPYGGGGMPPPPPAPGGYPGSPMFGGAPGMPPPPPPPPMMGSGAPTGFVDYNNLNGANTSAGGSNNHQHFTISTQPAY